MKDFNLYISKVDDQNQKKRIQEILDWISINYTHLEKRIAWNQPHFVQNGTFIIGFSYAKGHVSVAPEKKTMDKFRNEAEQKGYETTQQLIKIKWKQEVDYALLKKIIDFNIEEKKDIKSYWRTE